VKYLLDTNVVSQFQSQKAERSVREWLGSRAIGQMSISVITLMELQYGIEAATDLRHATKLTRWLEDEVLFWFEDRIIDVDTGIARQAARLVYPDPMEFRDALIAATALQQNLTLVTRNTKHFERTEVELINPWQ
jgi:predicted nucleic acid-binding protein